MFNANKKQNISSYTPSLLDVNTLGSIFVKRQPLLNDIYARHKSSILEKSKHFTLLVGPRGMGKTHLMSMLYHKFSNDKKINHKVMIAWLREEEWGIASYLDLLTQIIKTLIAQYELSDLGQRVEQLLSLSSQEAEYQAEKILIGILKQKVLLILTENLNLIFDSIEKDGQEKFRALIQNTGKITIIATSQSLFTGVSLRTCPFYGFFNITHLERLSFNDAVELLINIAKYEEKQDLVEILQTEKGRVRVRALHHLAGGSPRIYVIFSQFIQADSLDEFTGPMLKMLDELTPYYQAKMLELSPQQRKLVTFLCRARGAVTVQEIARQNHITQQTASGQLKKLKVSGFVESQKSGKESYYEIAEPLMRLVFSVKENRGTPVSIVIELIRHWFSLDELQRFKDDESLKAFGKNFIDGNIIQQAMEVKEPNPHLSSSMKEFNQHFSTGEFIQAKNVLTDLTGFSTDLSNGLHEALFNYLQQQEANIRGKSINKRIELTNKVISSIPETHIAVLRFNYINKNLALDEQDIVMLISGVCHGSKHSELSGFFMILLRQKRISIEIVHKIFKKLNLGPELVFGINYLSLIEQEGLNSRGLKIYLTKVLKITDLSRLSFFIVQNEYVSDLFFFKQLKHHDIFTEDLILTFSIRFTADKTLEALKALTDTTLENIKNESIYKSIQSLKAYSENGDKKHLMSLPKEVRSLILDKQPERIND